MVISQIRQVPASQKAAARQRPCPPLWGGCREAAGEVAVKNLFRHGLRRATFPKGEGFLRLRRRAARDHAALPKLRWFHQRGSAHALPFGEGAAKRRERLPQKPLPSRLRRATFPKGEGFLRLRREAACGHAALPKLRWFRRRGSAHAPPGEGFWAASPSRPHCECGPTIAHL